MTPIAVAFVAVLSIFLHPEIICAQSPTGSSNRSAIESRLSKVGPVRVEEMPVHPRQPLRLPDSLQGYEIPRNQVYPSQLAPNDAPERPIAGGDIFDAASLPQVQRNARGRLDAQSDRQPDPFYGQSFNALLTDQAEQMITRQGTGSSVKIAIMLAALSLAPALILMTTCYVRVVVVLTLLRQAFGGQQLPSTQILTALSLFVTFLVMAPTWNQIKNEALDPYTQTDSQMSFETALNRAVVPVKQFMARQISMAKNESSVAMFYRYLPRETANQPVQSPSSIDEVPLNVLMPAFLVSELKVAFLLGFQVYLPFLIVDLVVASVTVSMGMVMLPPTMVSFPLKLILFVMVDGWTLVVGMLMQSFGPL